VTIQKDKIWLTFNFGLLYITREMKSRLNFRYACYRSFLNISPSSELSENPKD